MRTKTLLLSAALTAAGIATSMAQVYSVNAVGYVNQTIGNGFSLIANPFKNATNTLNALLDPNLMPGAGVGVTVYRFTPAGYVTSTVDPLNGGVWQDANGNPNGDAESLVFGDGVFISNLTGSPFTVTWVGEVEQGSPINNTVPAGFSIKASKVPQAGKLQTDLGYPVGANSIGDVVFKWNTATQGYVTFTQDPLGGGTASEWQDEQGNPTAEPTLNIAESAFINSGVLKTWARNFTVN